MLLNVLFVLQDLFLRQVHLHVLNVQKDFILLLLQVLLHVLNALMDILLKKDLLLVTKNVQLVNIL